MIFININYLANDFSPFSEWINDLTDESFISKEIFLGNEKKR
jgi:hypothetical protein